MVSGLGAIRRDSLGRNILGKVSQKQFTCACVYVSTQELFETVLVAQGGSRLILALHKNDRLQYEFKKHNYSDVFANDLIVTKEIKNECYPLGITRQRLGDRQHSQCTQGATYPFGQLQSPAQHGTETFGGMTSACILSSHVVFVH